MKFKTVKDGEQAIIRNHLGEGRLVIGPERVFLFRERLEKLTHHEASQYQYLVMKDNFGIVTHKNGPCEMFHNPLEHDNIWTNDAIKIDANHMIVVYKRTKSSVERNIIKGPAVFFPGAEEWLHTFQWHGVDPSNKTRMIPDYRKFTQIAAIPDQFYYNVRDVRTTDDTMITVKLMIFYELRDVIKMLNTTHDPIADMINAVCADVIAYVGRRTYSQFLQETEKLSDLKTFSQLLQRAERIGFDINKVVYRGYHASDQLQSMQTEAIEARTRMRLNTELEEQKQKLVDYKLQKEQNRTKLRQRMETSKQEHEQKMEELKQRHLLEKKEKEHMHALQLGNLESTASLDLMAAEQNQEAEFLNSLHNLEVDMTKYLVSQQTAPVSEEIQMVKGTSLRTAPESQSPRKGLLKTV